MERIALYLRDLKTTPWTTAREVHIWLSVENQQFMGNHAFRFTTEVFTKMMEIWREQQESAVTAGQVE